MANDPNRSGQYIAWYAMRDFMASPLAFAFDRHSWFWITLGTDKQRLSANTTSVPTPSVTGFCFTSLVFFYFLLSFVFSSDGPVV